MSQQTWRRSLKVTSDINVTPMVDVMLVLLIIFMVITPMLQRTVSVDLAKTDNPVQMPDADKEDSLLVAVMRDGSIFFGSDKVTPEVLTDKVKDRLANRADKRVFIKADAARQVRRRGRGGGQCALRRSGRAWTADRAAQAGFVRAPAGQRGGRIRFGQRRRTRVDLSPDTRTDGARWGRSEAFLWQCQLAATTGPPPTST